MYGRCELREVVRGRSLEVGEGLRNVSDGISRYLTKYVAKESAGAQAWWDFKGFMSGLEAAPSQIAAVTGVRQYGNL